MTVSRHVGSGRRRRRRPSGPAGSRRSRRAPSASSSPERRRIVGAAGNRQPMPMIAIGSSALTSARRAVAGLRRCRRRCLPGQMTRTARRSSGTRTGAWARARVRARLCERAGQPDRMDRVEAVVSERHETCRFRDREGRAGQSSCEANQAAISRGAATAAAQRSRVGGPDDVAGRIAGRRRACHCATTARFAVKEALPAVLRWILPLDVVGIRRWFSENDGVGLDFVVLGDRGADRVDDLVRVDLSRSGSGRLPARRRVARRGPDRG